VSSAVVCNWCGTFAEKRRDKDGSVYLPDSWVLMQCWQLVEPMEKGVDRDWITRDWCGRCDPRKSEHRS